MHIVKLKMQQLLGPQVDLRPLVQRLMYVQTKQILKNKFFKMPRISCIEIDILSHAYTNVPGKVRESIFDT